MEIYEVEVRISKQEDGLWRAEVPSLPGCFVDDARLAQALTDIQEVAAMMLDLYLEQGKILPSAQRVDEGILVTTKVPIIIEEHKFRRPSRAKFAGTAPARDLPRA